jgi:hypothetical protein
MPGGHGIHAVLFPVVRVVIIVDVLFPVVLVVLLVRAAT